MLDAEQPDRFQKLYDYIQNADWKTDGHSQAILSVPSEILSISGSRDRLAVTSFLSEKLGVPPKDINLMVFLSGTHDVSTYPFDLKIQPEGRTEIVIFGAESARIVLPENRKHEIPLASPPPTEPEVPRFTGLSALLRKFRS